MGISFTCLGPWHRLVIFWKGFGHVWTFVQVFCRFPLGSVYSLQHLPIADGLLPEVSCSTRIEPPSFFFKESCAQANFTCWILLGAYWTTNGSFLKIHPARCETGAGFSDHCCVDTEVFAGTGGANKHPASHEIDAARTLQLVMNKPYQICDMDIVIHYTFIILTISYHIISVLICQRLLPSRFTLVASSVPEDEMVHLYHIAMFNRGYTWLYHQIYHVYHENPWKILLKSMKSH